MPVPAKSHIRLHQVRYRGTPIFGDDGEEYVDYLPDETRYVGTPSDEIDEAWNKLTTRKSLNAYMICCHKSNILIGRFFLLSAEEARAQWGPSYTRYWNEGWGGYAAR
jgi:hypothetical protein